MKCAKLHVCMIYSSLINSFEDGQVAEKYKQKAL